MGDKQKDLLAPARERGRKRLLKLLKAEGGVIELSDDDMHYLPGKVTYGRKNGWTWEKHLLVRFGHKWFAPTWQFKKEVSSHMEKILKILNTKKVSGLTIMIFFLNKNLRLDGKTPLQALREGRVKEVMHAAQCYLEHGAA